MYPTETKGPTGHSCISYVSDRQTDEHAVQMHLLMGAQSWSLLMLKRLVLEA